MTSHQTTCPYTRLHIHHRPLGPFHQLLGLVKMKNSIPMGNNPQTRAVYMSMNPQPPSSWLEMGLVGHALTFNLHINGEQVVVMTQHPTDLAQIIMEGMRLGLDAFMQHHCVMTLRLWNY